MPYAEEREFTLRVVLRCAFPDGYEGDQDGYAWASEAPAITADVLRAAVQSLSQRPDWTLRGGNRGRPVEDELVLVLERRPHDLGRER